VECWVKSCDGNHDAYRHPVHTCEMPISPFMALLRKRAGQAFKQELVMDPLPEQYTCTCGKSWKLTRIGLDHGWERTA